MDAYHLKAVSLLVRGSPQARARSTAPPSRPEAIGTRYTRQGARSARLLSGAHPAC